MSATNMTILGFLMQRPMYGYEFKKEILCRNMEIWASIKLPAIYKALPRLEERGFIKGKLVKSEASPDKKVYTITGDGKNYLRKLVLKKLNGPFNPPEFLLAIAFVNGVIKLSEFKAALETFHKLASEEFRKKEGFKQAKRDAYINMPFNWQTIFDVGVQFSYHNMKMYENLMIMLKYKENQNIFIKE